MTWTWTSVRGRPVRVDVVRLVGGCNILPGIGSVMVNWKIRVAVGWLSNRRRHSDVRPHFHVGDWRGRTWIRHWEACVFNEDVAFGIPPV